MSSSKRLTGVVLAAAVAALAAPGILADQKPDGSRTRYMDAWTSGDFSEPPGSTGWGGGSIVMPVEQQLGRIVGVVTSGDAADRYMVEAELTGCIPSTDLTGPAEYWFGGLYGRMQQLVDSPTSPGRDEVPWFRVEGMWFLDKHLEGTFSGELIGRNEAGTPYVCGVVHGRFEVSEAMPAPGQPMTFKMLDDRRPFDKQKLAGTPFTDRSTGTITCPKNGDPVRAVDLPKTSLVPSYKSFDDRRPFDKRKLAGTPFGDRSTGTITCPKDDDPVTVIDLPKAEAPSGSPIGYLTTFSDAGELRRRKTGGVYELLPSTAGWRDARSTKPPYSTPTPNWPVLTGTFNLRYQLYE